MLLKNSTALRSTNLRSPALHGDDAVGADLGDAVGAGAGCCNMSCWPMSGVGQSRPRLPTPAPTDVRSYSNNDQNDAARRMTRSARRRHSHRSKLQPYSITSSARASSIGDTSRPSALAVLRLIASSNLSCAWTGSSPAFSPLRMRSTYIAARRKLLCVSNP